MLRERVDCLGVSGFSFVEIAVVLVLASIPVLNRPHGRLLSGPVASSTSPPGHMAGCTRTVCLLTWSVCRWCRIEGECLTARSYRVWYVITVLNGSKALFLQSQYISYTGGTRTIGERCMCCGVVWCDVICVKSARQDWPPGQKMAGLASDQLMGGQSVTIKVLL
jgi:hypothetical protein